MSHGRAYPFNVDELLFGRHEEVEDTFDELGLLQEFFEPCRGQHIVLEDVEDRRPEGVRDVSLPVPALELLVLQDVGAFILDLEPLVVNLSCVVGLQVAHVVRNDGVEGKAQRHLVEVLIDLHEEH